MNALSLSGFRVLSRGSFSGNLKNVAPLSTLSKDEKLVVHQALNLLNQKLYVLELVTAEDYVKKVPIIFDSSVGSHLRHSLDHFTRLIDAANSPNKFANYDERKRNTVIEIDPSEAKNVIEGMKEKIQLMNLSSDVEVSFIGDEKTFDSYKVKSTVFRELSFVSHHAVHHLSMIKLILNYLNYQLPSDSPLGIALSTAKDIAEKK